MYFVNKEDNFYMCDETIRFLIFIKEKKMIMLCLPT